MKHFAPLKKVAHANHSTINFFGKYAHILFFAPLAMDHIHEVYGMVLAGAGLAAVAASVIANVVGEA